MANNFYKCKDCIGNMWPDSASGRDHKHLTVDELRKRLKLKLRIRKVGWSKPCNPRTNAPAKKTGTSLRPRRRAYGPF